MDMEWAKDGDTGELYCVQARPETVHARRQGQAMTTFKLKAPGEVIVTGVAIGEAIASGRVKLLHSPAEMDRFADGDILVTERTDPDWGPIMKRAAAIVTDHGGRTSHAAIVSRELGVPALVGAHTATRDLRDGDEVTVSCAEGGEGRIYRGLLDYEEREIDLAELPEPPVQLMINLAAPEAAFRWWRLPVRGVGLARMEFIISNVIKIHPLALSRFDQLEDDEVKTRIDELTAGYDDKTWYFVERLARGIATIAAAQHPHPVIVRMSDFKTNEYAMLIGGRQFEPKEENPMLGFRGASRYYSDRYKDGFALECRAVKHAREVIGLDNIVVMIPFVRTPQEADRVIEVMAEHGLARGENGLELYMMCEIPSNVILAEQFAERFDGFSIGSNDLTQLVLGVDRDSDLLSELFDERNEAVRRSIAHVIAEAHRAGRKIGICGQAPSDYPEFARFLVDCGIDSMSLNPDSVLDVIRHLDER
jgi:pyruvate, water dikinase